MRVFLAISVILYGALAQKIGINVPCNKELDGLLTADPDGDERAFMSCQGVGVGTIGFWERKLCPNNMVFDFINQQCKDVSKKARKQQTLSIAILNNSCANGETCIGGSVCDLDSLKCMCPYGTVPKLDTLSCESESPPFVSATVDGPSQLFNSFSNFGSSQAEFKPNNNFNNNNNNNNNDNNQNFNWNPNFSWKGNQQIVTSNHNSNNNNNENNNNENNNEFNPFQPNPNQAQKFVFNFNKNLPTNPPTIEQPSTQKVATLAIPGASCKSNEICVGGSICTLPIGICLCPGDLEARDGECVLPAASTISVQKVGIGALCSDLAECDHGSSCIMGRCICVSPLVQHDGKCVLKQQQKLVGPGELCDNGEICGKGSVCDVMIPVCVCPAHTDLNNGECIQVTLKVTPAVMTPPPTLPPIQIQTLPPTTRPQPMPTTQQQTRPTYPQVVYQTTPAPMPTLLYTMPPPATTKQQPIYTTHPKPSVKINQMKIGGSKQAGVGVRCSLNTDCMIGAYCNGNTNPPSCQCLSTHVNIEGRCEKVIYPGQVGCRSDSQCNAAYTGTHCIDRICVCPDGQKAVDQTCVSASEPVTSPPGGSCSNLRECTGGSVCKEGWCICPDPSMIVNRGICIQSGPKPTLPPKLVMPVHVPTVTRAQITVTEAPQGKKIVPGGKCGPLDSCVGGSHCIEGFCLCPAGQYPSSNGRCEKATTTTLFTTQTPATTARVYSKPGESCSLNQTCVGGSTCSYRKICECPQDKPQIENGQCSVAPKKMEVVPGASCDANSVCIRGSKCENGLCRCQPGHIAVSGNCILVPMSTTPKMKVIAKPLESCENGETCEGGSQCDIDTEICMCPPGQIVFNTQCMPPPTQPATFPTKVSTVPVRTTFTTKKPTFATDCEKDANCSENKICVSGKCKCKPGFVDNSGVCEPLEGNRQRLLKYGQACDRYQDKCTNGAKCIDKICKCAQGFMLSASGWCEGFVLEKAIENHKKATTIAPSSVASTKSRPVVTPFTDDDEDIFPTPPSSIFGFTARPKAPRVVAVGSSCEPSDICLGESFCSKGVCQCAKKFFLQNGHCIPKNSKNKIARVGQSCRNNEICAGGSICDNDMKKCICAAQHISIGGICKHKTAPPFSAPGDTCSMGEQCVGGSTCFEGMCTCDDNHFPENGYCRPLEARSSNVQFINGAGLRFSSKNVPNRQRAQPCNPVECQLPNCFCSETGREPPAGLRPEDTPQFVVLTFDDAVNGKTFPDYKSLFENDVLKNPNGCDVKATFFVSHEWTNYDSVNWLVQKGMEVASNSISHENLEHATTTRWLNEMDGQRRILAKFGGAGEENIVGMRAPQLAAGSDKMFEMMVGAEFLYDNSMSTNPGIHGEPFWPQTLDYQVSWECWEESCPKSSFPGIWTVPLNQFYGSYMAQIDSFRRSSMLRAAVDLNDTVNELEEVIMRNFERSYSTNRAPYILSMNADFLQLGGRNKGMIALKKFLNKITRQKDVYIVTIKQLIEWMKRPVPLSQMTKSKAVGCPISIQFSRNPSSLTCDKPNKCLYNTPNLPSQEHQFLTCLPCPIMYPWLENPAGTIV